MKLLKLLLIASCITSCITERNLPKPTKLFVNPTNAVIEYDFEKGEYTKSLERIRVHTPVVFKIKNINPFVYEVKITPKDSTQNDMFATLAALTSEDQEKIKKSRDLLKEIENNSIKSEKKVFQENDMKNPKEYKDVVKNIDKISMNRILTNKRVKVVDEIIRETLDLVSKSISDDKTVLQQIIVQEDLTKLELELTKMKNNSDSISADKIKLMVDIKENLKSFREISELIKNNNLAISESLKSYNELNSAFLADYERFISATNYTTKILNEVAELNLISSIPNLKVETVKEYYDQIIFFRKKIETNNDEIKSYKSKYYKLQDSYFKLVYTSTLEEVFTQSGVEKMMQYPKYINEQVSQLTKQLDSYDIDKLISNAISISRLLCDENTFTVNSAPIQPVGDLLVFKIDIKKRPNSTQGAIYREVDFIYSQPVFGGVRFDLSLGLAGSIFFDTPSYTLSKTSTIVKTDSKNLVAPAVVGLFTMSKRKTRYLSFGGSVGMGINTDNGKIELSNFYAGGTALVGRNERFLITGGVSLKNVREVRPQFLDSVVDPSTDLSSYMTNKYQIGPFLSATYNLTKSSLNTIKSLK